MNARECLTRMANLVIRRRGLEDRLRAEIEEHIALQTEENVRSGMEPGEARRHAMLKFGSVEVIAESYGEQESVPIIENLLSDLKYSVRSLRKSPGFSTVAVVTLALGIGSITSVFSIVNAALIRPLLYGHPDQLVLVWQLWERGDFRNPGRETFLAWRERSKSFDQLAAVVNTSFDLRGDPPVRLNAAGATANFFKTLDVEPQLGRVFSEDEARNGAHVLVLSYTVWKNQFGSDPGVLGKTVVLNGAPWTVIGVMPAGFSFVRSHDLWVPMEITVGHSLLKGSLLVVGRLRPGVTLVQAQAEMDTLQPDIARDFPDREPTDNTRALLMPLRNFLLGGSAERMMMILLGAVAFVLLIACANVSHLLLARGVARQKEIALRVALGASRSRILRQLLTESLMLAAAGAGGGLLIAWCAVTYLARLPLLQSPGAPPVAIDPLVMAFTAGTAAFVALLAGFVPAWQASQIPLMESIKSASGATIGNLRHDRLRSALVVGEIALSVMLLAGAGLAIRSFINTLRVDPGFKPDNLLTMELSVAQYKSARAATFYQQALERVRALPGVESADICTTLPLIGWNYGVGFRRDTQPKEQPGQFANLQVVTDSFFRTLGVPVVRGRGFTPQDTATSLPVVIINRHLAERFFKDENPVGRELLVSAPFAPSTVPHEIVGVVGDVKDYHMNQPSSDDLYLAYDQTPVPYEYLIIRTARDPEAFVPSVRAAIASVDRDQPLEDIATMRQRLDYSLSTSRFMTLLLSAFGSLAMLLAAIGIYGVIAYTTAQRTPEFGLRMALGAPPSSLLRMVLSGGLKLAVAGCAIGLVGALALTRALNSIAFGLTPRDPVALGAALVCIFLAALLASLIPARRATRVDPMVALRYD